MPEAAKGCMLRTLTGLAPTSHLHQDVAAEHALQQGGRAGSRRLCERVAEGLRALPQNLPPPHCGVLLAAARPCCLPIIFAILHRIPDQELSVLPRN